MEGTMLTKSVQTSASGQYFWELIFSYDNRDSKASKITRTINKEKERQVNSRVFMSEKFKLSSGFKFKNQTNASLSFDGIGAGNKTEFSFHIDTAMELEESSETSTNVRTKEFFEETLVVEPGDSLAAYRLCYVTNGVFLSTDVISVASVDDQPPESVIVELKFSAKLRLLGYRLVADKLRDTRPREENMSEWAAIRNTIISSSSKDQFAAFRDLVVQLSETMPYHANKVEWANIRQTCGEILRDWDSVEKQLLFHKLLSRFIATHPTQDNRQEWAGIRSIAETVLNEVEVFL